MPRQGATPGSGSKAGGGTTSKSKAKSVPTTPVGAAIPVAGGAGFKTQPTKLPSAAPLAINPARYMQVMESNNEQEMAVYLQVGEVGWCHGCSTWVMEAVGCS